MSFLITLGWFSVNAQDQLPATDTISYDLILSEEVIISSDPLKNTWREFPGSIGLITQSTLEEDHVNVATHLNKVPGVFMHNGAINTNRITIRGIGSRSPFSTNRVKAYFGEIPLTTGEGETTIEDLDMLFIERIEVVKGPNATLFGAGLGGTIKLVPPATSPTTSSLRTSLGIGSFGTNRQSALATILAAKHDIQVGFTRMHSDGYRENNRYDRLNALVTGRYTLSNDSKLSWILQWIRLDAQIPSSLNDSTFRVNPSAAASNWANVAGFENYDRYQVGFSYEAGNQYFRNTTSVFHSGQLQDERRPFNVLDDKRFGAGIRNISRVGLSTTGVLAFGFELFFEEYKWSTFVTENDGRGSLLSQNREMRNYQNFFSQVEITVPPGWELTAGFNINFTQFRLTDQVTGDGDQSGRRQFTPVFSPRLAVSYSPTKRYSLYLAGSHGFSTPSLEETLTPEGDVNPGIKPETGWNFEIGTKGSFRQSWRWQVALFHMPISNLLVAERTAEDAFLGRNAGRTHHSGVEIDLHYLHTVTKALFFELSLHQQVARYVFKDFVDDGEDRGGNRLPGVPSTITSASLRASMPWKMKAVVNTGITNKMALDDANSGFTSAYTVTDIHLVQSVSGNKWTLKFSAGVKNIFDERYASMIQINASGFGGNAPRYFYPGLPRNYFLGVSLNLRSEQNAKIP